MVAAYGLDVLCLHDLVEELNGPALGLCVLCYPKLAQMSSGMAGKALACFIPCATQLAHMHLIVGVCGCKNTVNKREKEVKG